MKAPADLNSEAKENLAGPNPAPPPFTVWYLSFANFPTMSSLLLPLLISSVVVARQVHISVDASSSMGVFPPVARFFGADVSADEAQTSLTGN